MDVWWKLRKLQQSSGTLRWEQNEDKLAMDNCGADCKVCQRMAPVESGSNLNPVMASSRRSTR